MIWMRQAPLNGSWMGSRHASEPWLAKMNSHPLTELDHRERRREILGTIVDAVLAGTVVLVLFYVIPFSNLTSAQSLLRLVVGIAAFVAVLVWQLRRVARANFPGLRAVHALAVTIPLFLVVFAAVYLALAQGSPTHFSEPLDHTGALYLTITVFSTVGFGDITPESELARIVVSIQMLLDLVVIGVVVRLLTTAAKTGTRKGQAPETPDVA
jgi:voltage-gated potassium channel